MAHERMFRDIPSAVFTLTPPPHSLPPHSSWSEESGSVLALIRWGAASAGSPNKGKESDRNGSGLFSPFTKTLLDPPRTGKPF